MKRYFTILAVLFASYGMANAQNIEGAKVDIHDFEYNADSVTVNLTFDLKDLELGATESMVFTPEIIKGQTKKALPAVIVKSRGGAKSYNRAKALKTVKSLQEYDKFYKDAHKEINFFGSYNKEETVDYKLTIPYETWMINSELMMDCMSYGCCTYDDNGTMAPLNNKLTVDIPPVKIYEVTPELEFIKPAKVAEKRRDIQYSSALIFKVNSTVIDPSLGQNQYELNSIYDMMQGVVSDDDYTITKVNIIGYASPEGSLQGNMRLSEGRAKALETLMKREYPMINPRLYGVSFGGENWDKLAEIVEAGDLPEKNEILNIIRNVSIIDGRETKLMRLNGGRTYNYLLKNIFPATRLVVVNVEYLIKDYNIDRIKELIYSKPENLSLEEMYRLSEIYKIDDKEFEDIFVTAMRVYPDDIVARHNALVSEIRQGDLESASKIVKNIDHNSDSGEIINSLGVYYMLKGDYKVSEEMLLKSKEMGNGRAIYNLEELSKKKANLEEIRENEEFRAKIYGEQ